MEIIYAVIIIFGITTILGLYLSSLVLRNKQTPKAVIIIHGMFTITGFVLLFIYYPEAIISILFFSIATLCGLILLFQDITGKKFAKWLCSAHGLFTVAGFIFLLVFAFIH